MVFQGRSQTAVIELLEKSMTPLSAQEIGDALYATTSSCAKFDGGSMDGKATPEERRKAWATKIVASLKKKGLVEEDPSEKRKYRLKK